MLIKSIKVLVLGNNSIPAEKKGTRSLKKKNQRFKYIPDYSLCHPGKVILSTVNRTLPVSLFVQRKK